MSLCFSAPALQGARHSHVLPDPTDRTCQLARDVAGAMLAVPAEDLARAERSRKQVCEARHVGMYIAHVVFQLPFRAVAEGFHRHRSTVSYAVRQIEERRDDGRFDELLTLHERRAEALRDQMTGASA